MHLREIACAIDSIQQRKSEAARWQRSRPSNRHRPGRRWTCWLDELVRASRSSLLLRRRPSRLLTPPGRLSSLSLAGVQHFFQFFKSLVGQEVIVELKNDLKLRGTLHSVDQYLNIKLTNLVVENAQEHPHLASVNNCFIRGSVVRYIHLPKDAVDLEVLHDATRRNHRGEAK